MICSHAGQLIMMSVYGIQVRSRKDRYIKVAQAVMDAVSEAAKPGAYLVDAFPFCKCNLIGMIAFSDDLFSEVYSILVSRCILSAHSEAMEQ